MLDFITSSYAQNEFFTFYIWGLIIVLGLVIGSFLNVVGLRLLSDESIVFPPSKCPKCNTRLKWYDNIPVLAYLILMGRCRYCKEKISLQYPIVELLTSIIFLLIFLQFGFSIGTLFLWVLAGAVIVMCITDFKEQIIFDAVSMPLIPIGLIYSYFNFGGIQTSQIPVFNLGFSLPENFISSIIGIVAAFLIFEIISFFSKILIKNRAFGEGDTVIAMIFGAWFGWKALILTILLSFFVQTLFVLPLMVVKLFKIKDKTAALSFCILIISAISPLILNKFAFFYTALGSIMLIVGTLGTAAISAMIFLRRMKELQAFTMLPFGPALIFAGFLVIFFEEKFLSIIGL